MKTLLIETERRAYTVQDRIDAGDVELVDCIHLPEVEKIIVEVMDKKRTPDIIVIDTFTTLKTQTMLDVAGEKAGLSKSLNLYAKKDQFKATQPEWGVMSDLLTRLVYYVRDMPQTIILVCHEATREVEDGLYERRAPALNPALIGPVLDNSDIIIRLGVLGKETEIDKVRYPAGTRVGRIREDDKHVAKASTPSRAIVPPPVLIDPTLESIRLAIGGKHLPGMITIYGSQGAGKTNLACTGHTLYTTKGESRGKT